MAQPPAFLVSLPSQVEATDGDIVTFQVRVSGDPKPIVTWFRCGEVVSHVKGRWDLISHEDGWHELLVTNLNVQDEGEYECRAENTYGQASCFGDLFYYCVHDQLSKGGQDGTGRMDDDDDDSQGALMILIDDGSQTDDDENDDPSRRRSLTASEQMQGIIEDLTSEDSLTLCRDEFGCNETSEPTLIFDEWHHSNTNPSTPPNLQTMSEGKAYPPGSPRMVVPSPECFSCPVSDMTSWYPQTGPENSLGELSSDNVSSLSTLEGDQVVAASGEITPQNEAWPDGMTTLSREGSLKSKREHQCWDIVEEEEDQTVPVMPQKTGFGESSGVNPPAMSYSRSTSSYKSSSSSYKYSEGASEDSFGRSSISSSGARTSRLDRLDSSDRLSSSSLRRTTGRVSIDDDDATSTYRRTSRTSTGIGALDDDDFSTRRTTRRLEDDDFSTRRTTRRLEDDTDSGLSSLRRTTRLSSRDDDEFGTSSLRRGLTSRLSTDDDDFGISSYRRGLSSRLSTDDDSPSKRISSKSSATHEDETDEKRSVRRSTRTTSLDTEDDGYSFRKSKLSSSLDVEDELSSLSVRANRSASSYEGEEDGMKVKSTRNIINYSESFSSDSKTDSI